MRVMSILLKDLSIGMFTSYFFERANHWAIPTLRSASFLVCRAPFNWSPKKKAMLRCSLLLSTVSNLSSLLIDHLRSPGGRERPRFS